MTIILYHTIMIYCCSCIYNTMIAYYSISINNGSSHYHSSFTNFSRKRDNSRRVYSLRKLHSSIVGLQPLHYHLSYFVHPNAHYHRRKTSCIMQNWTTTTLIHIRIIINKGLYFDTIDIQNFLYHFAVTTCSE